MNQLLKGCAKFEKVPCKTHIKDHEETPTVSKVHRIHSFPNLLRCFLATLPQRWMGGGGGFAGHRAEAQNQVHVCCPPPTAAAAALPGVLMCCPLGVRAQISAKLTRSHHSEAEPAILDRTASAVPLLHTQPQCLRSASTTHSTVVPPQRRVFKFPQLFYF